MTLVQLFVYFSYRHYSTPQTKAAYIVVSLITSSYTYSWDVYMDWGLFRFGKHGGGAYGHPFLRQELVYSRKWVYYVAIILDFVGRFAWLARLIPTSLSPFVLSFILALIEIFRRWVWNFFRLENEHLNNCGQFRAIKDIPLPFHILVEGESEEEEEEEEQEGEEQFKHDTERPDVLKFDDGDETYVITAEGGTSDLKPTEASQKRQQSLARTATMRSGRSIANLGSAGPTGTSRASLRSATTSFVGSHRSGLRRRGSQLSESPFNIQRSNTFVDNAMTEAGFESDRRERLTAINKFYDRRDFDSKIIETPSEGLFTLRTRSSTGGLSMMHGLGVDPQDGGTPRSAVKRKGSKIFGWMRGSDEDDTDEDD
ncbi:EXS family-domain-containing protein [Dissophora ornata]|nr:EXS family-domain-containing protein [Dissophora ornata]